MYLKIKFSESDRSLLLQLARVSIAFIIVYFAIDVRGKAVHREKAFTLLSAKLCYWGLATRCYCIRIIRSEHSDQSRCPFLIYTDQNFT